MYITYSANCGAGAVSEKNMPATEKKSVQVHMMMSPTEVAAIDDWSFRNRVRGRTEAVRRLSSIGLALETQEQELEHLAETVSVGQLDRFRSAILAMPDDDSEPGALSNALLRIVDEAIILAADAAQLSTAVTRLLLARDEYAWHSQDDKGAEARASTRAELDAFAGEWELRRHGLRLRLAGDSE